jgi:hypothetical protein
MIESSKVAFVKKILKEQGLPDISSTSFNDGKNNENKINSSILFVENDSQLSKSLNESNRLNSTNKYSRGFINDFLSYLKHSITPRFVDIK